MSPTSPFLRHHSQVIYPTSSQYFIPPALSLLPHPFNLFPLTASLSPMPAPSLFQAHLTSPLPRHPSYVTYFMSSQYLIPPTSSLLILYNSLLPHLLTSSLIPHTSSLLFHPSYPIHPTNNTPSHLSYLIPRLILPTSSFLTHPLSTPC